MLFTPLERLIAFRYMRSRRSEGFISVVAWFSLAGITLGVATLIIVMSVMNGFRAELIGRILGLNGHLAIYQSGGAGITDYSKISLQLSEIDNIIAVTPQVEGQVMATAKGQNLGAVIRGVAWSDLAARKPLWESLQEDTIERFRQGEHVLIGRTMAFNLGLKTGDSLTLLAANGRATAFGTLPVRRTFKIAGLFSVGMHEYDSNFIFMTLKDSQQFLGLQDRVSGIELYAADPMIIESARAEITKIAGPDNRVFSWRDRNSSFLNALQVERNVMFLILTLIILVAGFNIISSMIMLVRSKHADIAVLRAMGASRASITRIFLITGSSIGLLGTSVGTILGLLFCWNIETIKSGIEGLTGSELFAAEIYFLSQLPAKVDPHEVLSVIAMALTLSLLASIYPALKAANIQPAEVLRYE